MALSLISRSGGLRIDIGHDGERGAQPRRMPLLRRPDAVVSGVVDRGNLYSLYSMTRVDIVCEMALLNSVNVWTPAAFDAS
jgi:hypothetical protein